MKLWDARFNKVADQRLNDFNSSIHFDQRFYAVDIKGSIAHVTMLAKQKIITDDDKNQIIHGLNEIKQEIENGQLLIDLEAEDIHMFIESELTKRIGDAGKRLHTARSRNDQVALDLRLYVIDEIDEMIKLVKSFIEVILNKAAQHTDTIMSGYTHMQRAQPITFAHYLMAYVEMFVRDIERLEDTKKRTKVLPLGSGALATTTYPIDREYTKDLLDFHAVSLNSLDGVSDRDFAIELANDLSILMMHLSRMSEEIILWCSHEFKYIELDDAFATGSSIMPQKKNPDICELIRGKSGRVIGDLNTLLIMMKGLPLAYNKDMQEDKEALFDAIDTTKACLVTITPMLETATIKKENMLKAANEGFINATDLADYLTKKGMPFRDAYKITGKLVNYSIQNKKVLETLSIEEYRQVSSLFEEDVYQAIDLKNCVMNRKAIGGPNPDIVKKHIEIIKHKIR